VWVGIHQANIISHSDTQIVFTIPSGTGKDRRIYVDLNNWPKEWSNANILVDYPSPYISYAEQNPGNERQIISTTVTVYGGYFGLPGDGQVISVTIGGTACTHVQVVADNKLTCNSVAVGANQAVTVWVDGVATTDDVRIDLPNPVTPGLNCVPPFGAQDINNLASCNCFSGYAPLNTLLNTDCDLIAVCPGNVLEQASVNLAAYSQPITTFSDDNLYIYQSSPIVRYRRDTVLQFAVPNLGDLTPNAGDLGAYTCWHPGNIWVKTVNDLDCLDEFSAILPWTQAALCGFVEDTNAEEGTNLKIYKSNLVTSYIETVNGANGKPHFRKISNSFLITVTFIDEIKVILDTQVNVYIADPDESAAITVELVNDLLYDPATKFVDIVFYTSFVWPYQIAFTQIAGAWTSTAGVTGVVGVTIQLTSVQPGDLVCDENEDSTCGQQWLLTLNTHPDPSQPQVCNLNGYVLFNTHNLLCRDLDTEHPDWCPGFPSSTFQLNIATTDLCDDAPAVDTSVGIVSLLTTYADPLFQLEQTVFQTGDWIFLQASLTDPKTSIDSITINNVKVISSDLSVSDTLYYVDTPAAPVSDSSYLNGVLFNVTTEIRQPGPILIAGMTGTIDFQFRLYRNVLKALFGLDAEDTSAELIIEVTLDIFYHGNQKRTVIGSIAHTAKSKINLVPTDDAEVIANERMNVDQEVNAVPIFDSASSVVSVSAVATFAMFLITVLFA
jgi:hypothetical protein